MANAYKLILNSAGTRDELSFSGSQPSLSTSLNLLSYVFVNDLSGLDFSYYFGTADRRFQYRIDYGTVALGSCVNFAQPVSSARVTTRNARRPRSAGSDVIARELPADAVMLPFNYNGTSPMLCLLTNGTLVNGTCDDDPSVTAARSVSVIEKRAASLEGQRFQYNPVTIRAVNQHTYAGTTVFPNLQLSDSEVKTLATSICELYDSGPKRTNYSADLKDGGGSYARIQYTAYAASSQNTVPPEILYNIAFEFIDWVRSLPGVGSGEVELWNAEQTVRYGRIITSSLNF